MKRVVITMSVMAVLGLTARLQAEDLSGKMGISGIAQAGFPLGEKNVRDLAEDVGHDFGGMLSAQFTKHLGAGVSYDNINLRGSSARLQPILGNLLFRCRPDSRLMPTGQLGFGVAKAENGRESFDNFAARAGIGLDYFLTPAFAVGPQVNYTYVDNGGDGNFKNHVLGAGLRASAFFGGKSAAPAAPKQEVVKPTPVAAPADSDGDGVVDSADQCPNTPKGNSVNAQGCPADTDGDGVYDYADKCPETPNGIPVDADGCPKKMEEKVSIELKVLFDTGKDVVKPDYRSEIERVANFLKAYPDVKAEIEGHTDDVGPDTANQRLSQRRADAVRAYLLKEFSVDASRVKAVGYGETKPIADNKTAEGRSTNRRVIATMEAVKKS